jgi:hypothetical protein
VRAGCLAIAILFALALLAPRAEAQLGRRLQRRFGGAQPQEQPEPTPAAPRPTGQLRQNLGKVLQGAINSGAIEALAGDSQPAAESPAAAVAEAPNTLKAALPSPERPFTPAWYSAHTHAWKLPSASGDLWNGASIEQASSWLGLNTADAPAQPESGEQFLPLGVFALAPAGGNEPSALVQLAVRPDGTLRGNYLDRVTGTSWPIEGTLHKHTQLATFRASVPGSAEFEASLVSLTRPHGSVRLRFAGGETRDWNLARFESQ